MSDQAYIRRYFSFLEKGHSSFLQTEQMTDEKRNILDFIGQLLSQVSWQLLPKEEKQAHRISWLASLEQRGLNYQKQKDTVELYAAIQSALPHIIVLDQNGRLSKIRTLCSTICERIDFQGMAFEQVMASDVPSLSEAFEEIKVSLNCTLLNGSNDMLIELKHKLIKYFNYPK